MKPVYLAGAVRTPIGHFGGSLQSWTAADLGTAVAKEWRHGHRFARRARVDWVSGQPAGAADASQKRIT